VRTTIFLSAFLLFQVQPILGRYILPCASSMLLSPQMSVARTRTMAHKSDFTPLYDRRI
jgi:hypothetical protein